MALKYVGEITDPIHKNIKFTTVEKEIIDTSIFQRLRRIRQLAGAYLVYPGALHSRFEHSLGSMFLAGMAGQTLFDKGYFTDIDLIQHLRLAALLHDVGHGPFSHLFEEILKDSKNYSHENFGERIILETKISDIIKRNGYSPDTVSSLSFGKHNSGYLNEVISGGLSVDLMDYLPRDSYFSGTEYGKVDYFRIINSLEVASSKVLGINKSALYSYESMLISRYQMFKSVYFHKTVRSGEVMILHSMKHLNRSLHLTDFDSLEDFFALHDEMVLELLCNFPASKSRPMDTFAVKLARDYKSRNLLKCIYEYFSLSNQRFEKERDSKQSRRLPDRAIDFEKQIHLIQSIIGSHQDAGEPVFLDISRAPSIPLAPKKEEVTSIMIINKEAEYEKSFDQLPLINVITGYLDMIRVYTTKEKRNFFKSLLKDFENQNF
ncbi:HD domain-containing protein [Candidatus Nitrosocosmicus arcticus]|uniref:Putative metal dependent phosphohydrolase n=1 Tax=Candidatus Nitrosocosmicus arcticus TaxID=2035267 RepID=A0A557SYU8_9ARCH|nr:HD domain-containing protein [Candidatus Nitrosocosmicus arcticus]TVP41774.1 putative metal dependent phosphohydrolase [Candidatus Nitrosocosmicus arcticus]